MPLPEALCQVVEPDENARLRPKELPGIEIAGGPVIEQQQNTGARRP
jgi:hypothetical protein